jgi:hypothetical protein
VLATKLEPICTTLNCG